MPIKYHEIGCNVTKRETNKKLRKNNNMDSPIGSSPATIYCHATHRGDIHYAREWAGSLRAPSGSRERHITSSPIRNPLLSLPQGTSRSQSTCRGASTSTPRIPNSSRNNTLQEVIARTSNLEQRSALMESAIEDLTQVVQSLVLHRQIDNQMIRNNPSVMASPVVVSSPQNNFSASPVANRVESPMTTSESSLDNNHIRQSIASQVTVVSAAVVPSKSTSVASIIRAYEFSESPTPQNNTAEMVVPPQAQAQPIYTTTSSHGVIHNHSNTFAHVNYPTPIIPLRSPSTTTTTASSQSQSKARIPNDVNRLACHPVVCHQPRRRALGDVPVNTIYSRGL
eukprot:PhF_6_TR4733/c0_g1_i2/m.6548